MEQWDNFVATNARVMDSSLTECTLVLMGDFLLPVISTATDEQHIELKRGIAEPRMGS